MTLRHDEIEELLGAFALNAVDADEAAEIETHLLTCPRCRAEVDSHREVAAMLGSAGGPAPDAVWARIAGRLEEPAPEFGTPLARVVPMRRVLATRVAMALAAAAAVVALVLAVGLTRQGDRIDDLEAALADDALLRAASLAQADPNAISAKLTSLDGALSASAVVLPDGTGYLVGNDVPELGPDRTYQLWGIDDGKPVSLGVLGTDFKVAGFSVGRGFDQLALTEEAAGGAAQPTMSPRASAPLRA